ncbi:MAG: NAD(P)/FAD-dependent oxidoreductase [Chloroflexota bacterium]
MKIGIVGGGIMGLTVGYYLAKKGVSVHVYEASNFLGGLAGPIHLDDGIQVDRFYHAILSSDAHVMDLCQELNLIDQMHFCQTKMAFYFEDKLFSMNNMIEFFRFPPLTWLDRFRLGFTVLYAQFIKDWHRLEGVSVEKWLVALGGRRAYENIWRPMLRAKFDGSFDDVPATYIWSRLVRMKSTRSGANQKEEAGHIVGGYETLVKAMAEAIKEAGGQISLNSPVQEILIENEKAKGLQIAGEVHEFDKVIGTLQAPIFERLIPQANQKYRDYLKATDYLGIICPLMILDRPLTEYWTVNITDETIPFTGIVETTSYIDPKFVGGHHLVYLPKYTAPESQWYLKPNEEIQEIWLSHLEKMFPQFDRSWVRHFLVHRERYVEPLHRLNSNHLIPNVGTPIENLYLATTSQIYPALSNGEAVIRQALNAVEKILHNESAEAPSAMPSVSTQVVSSAAAH